MDFSSRLANRLEISKGSRWSIWHRHRPLGPSSKLANLVKPFRTYIYPRMYIWVSYGGQVFLIFLMFSFPLAFRPSRREQGKQGFPHREGKIFFF